MLKLVQREVQISLLKGAWYRFLLNTDCYLQGQLCDHQDRFGPNGNLRAF